MGKGSKERQVPFSLEMRKHLWKWMQGSSKINSPFALCSRTGLPLIYRNAYREIKFVCAAAGVKATVHPHLFRHQFAASYIRQGGDIYRLSRLLGHTAISTTQTYLRSMGIEDLRSGKERLTPLTLAS